MTDSYRGGYKKALLDIKTFLEVGEVIRDARSAKKYSLLICNLINLVLQNPESLDRFMSGVFAFKYNPKTMEVKNEDKSN